MNITLQISKCWKATQSPHEQHEATPGSLIIEKKKKTEVFLNLFHRKNKILTAPQYVYQPEQNATLIITMTLCQQKRESQGASIIEVDIDVETIPTTLLSRASPHIKLY